MMENNKNNHALFWVFLICFSYSCVGRPKAELKQPKTVIISWSEYYGSNADKISFYLDGFFLGKGAEGFSKILNEIDHLPSASKIIISSMPPEISVDGRPLSIIPFHHFEGKTEKLENICKKNKHILIYR